ncbi:MAG: hypothetical protein KUG78_11090 [Kangiellaceae bacterium]|nr:hypothetical protein [Kangiellaceae bacterium]
MYNKRVNRFTIATAILFCSIVTQAENTGEFDLNFQVKTNHLWHGFIVTPGVMTGGTLSYLSADEKSQTGVWGGASFNGEFQEFTYFTKYKFNDKWFVEIVNHGNHSSVDNVDIFNYSKDPSKTGNFTDIGLGYTFAGEMPISLYYSVIVQGIDTYTDEESGNDKQAYTNYLEVRIPTWKGKDNAVLDVFIAGAFSPMDDENFYDDKANIVNVGFTYNKSLRISEYNLPVFATAMWNPALKKGALEVGFSFF